MSKEIISDECAINAANIQLSENTKALILCRARLSDIHGNVSDIIESQYKGQIYEGIFKDFNEALSTLDIELMKIISMFIETTSLQSDYKEM